MYLYLFYPHITTVCYIIRFVCRFDSFCELNFLQFHGFAIRIRLGEVRPSFMYSFFFFVLFFSFATE